MESIGMKDFEVIKDLGAGSFGKVQLVRRKEDGELCAIKSVALARLNQKQKQSALNEVRLLASIHIPTVIGYKGAFFNMESQSLCVILEYADGGDLQQKIVDRQNTHPGDGFQESFIWKVAFDILQGLSTLHKNNIIHRDIKSANIFFAGGIAKLGDMNVSKLAEDGFCQTQTGTPYYTSPQIWKGQQYGNKCDIWSTGCLLYELCALKHPFKAADFPSLYRKITTGVYADIASKYSSKLRSLVRMCLTVDEQMRPSAGELLENSMFREYQMEMENADGQGQINMVQAIKCPKVLRFLNSRLPQAKEEQSRKKTVNFASRKQIKQEETRTLDPKLLRKARSEKAIQWQQDEDIKAPKIVSKNHVRLPPVVIERQGSQKHIASGLAFTSKKMKIKPQSSKLIPDLLKPISSKLIPEIGKENKRLIL